MDKNAVLRFLRRQWFVPKSEGPIVKMECFHIGTNRRNGPPTWGENFAPNQQIDETVIDRMADDIDNSTQDEADQLDGVQQYIIYVFRASTGDKPTARFPLRQTSQVEEDQDNPTGQSEPASLQGILAQQMRHNEALVRTSVGGWRDVIQVLQKMCARQADQLEFLQGRLSEQRVMVDDAESKKAERDAEISERKAHERRMDSAFETVMPLIPAAINMISGRKLLPEKTTPERMMVIKFMETISPEQFQQMRTTLEPEQYGIIATMLADIQAGIDSNLPDLFKRFLNSMPEATAMRLQTEVFHAGQVGVIRTMIESFERAAQAKAAKEAEAAKAKGGNGQPVA
jgi:hypothetical protein